MGVELGLRIRIISQIMNRFGTLNMIIIRSRIIIMNEIRYKLKIKIFIMPRIMIKIWIRGYLARVRERGQGNLWHVSQLLGLLF